MSSIAHKIPNHWVEKDAEERASHPKRYADYGGADYVHSWDS